MSNLNNVINKTKQLINMASKKTGDVVEISKLKMDKVNKGAELQKLYENLGKSCYLEFKSDVKQTEEMKEIIGNIEKLESDIKKIDDSIIILKNNKICKKCGNKNNKKALYCNLCGNTLYQESTDNCDNITNNDKTDQTTEEKNDYTIEIKEEYPDKTIVESTKKENQQNDNEYK